MRGTIKSKGEIDLLFSKGKRIHTDSILAIYLAHTSSGEAFPKCGNGRIAVIAGKRLGNAPQRNKAKRRIREAAQKAQAPWRGFDVVLIARNAVLEADFSTVVEDMNMLSMKIQPKVTKGGL